MSDTTFDLRALDRAICGDIWASDTAARNLERLCAECGGRFAGSDNYRRAVELVAELWRACGLSDVWLEPFPFTAWERGDARLTITAPVSRTYPCLALPYAPACHLDGELIDLGFGLEADFAAAGEAVRGRLALVRNGAPPRQRPAHRLEKYVRAVQAGAAAFIFADDQPGMLAPTGSLAFAQDGPLDQALPSVGIPFEVGAELSRWASYGPVRLCLQLDNRLRRAESWNVVGELPGRDADGPMLLIGGHLDGHDIAQGAIDNASGIVAITEIARVLANWLGQGGTAGQASAVTLRFVAFGAEELGMLGSYAYVQQHRAELDRLQFVFNLDCVGTGEQLGFALQICPELAPLFRSLAQEMAAGMEIGDQLVPFSDQFPFTLTGVPAAFIVMSGERAGRGWGHTAADTLDKVNVNAVRIAATTVSRLAARLASGQLAWPGRRRSPDEVKAALQAGGAEPLLRLLNAWPA